MRFQTVRGTFDVLPEAQGASVPGSSAWQHLEGRVRETMARFRFEEIRTPILEPLDLIARGVGATTDIVQKEMFVVPRDDGGALVLRPEVTAPVMRAFLEHRLDQRGGAQRLFYLGPCFRAERPQKGRYRQFHQFGVELIGSAEPVADAEAIACLCAIYEGFGISNTRLRINSLGDGAARTAYRDALRDYLTPHVERLSAISRQRLESNPLRILDTKNEQEKELLVDAPRITDFLSPADREHLVRVQAMLDRQGIDYVEDPLLVRGLDYYTGVVFELEAADSSLGAQRALAAGGRYDGLAEAVGSKQTVPAVGWAAGIERLFMALDATGYAFPTAARADAFLVALGDEAERWAFAEAQRLRASGLQVSYDLQSRSLKAQMKEASRAGARYAVVVGSDELERGAATLRDLDQSEQRDVPFDELLQALRGEQ